MKNLLPILFLVVSQSAPALETTDINFRTGTESDNLVTITRDPFGRLILDDAYTSPVTLQALRENTTLHGALTGLSADDHSQYLTAARHATAHDDTMNNDLPISGDVNLNQTLGDHISDTFIHLDLAENETVTGTWNFFNGLSARSSLVRLDLSQYGSHGALIFEDGIEDAELVYTTGDSEFIMNRPLVIDGAINTTTWTQPGPPLTQVLVKNVGTSISTGDVVIWQGLSDGVLEVAPLTTTFAAGDPFAGIALESASNGNTLYIATSGVASVPVSSAFSAGDVLGWDGSGARPITTSDTAGIGYALEDGTASGSALIMVQRVEGGF